MGLFSFSRPKKRSMFHGSGYYTGGFLHSSRSSRRYYDPRYAHTRPSMGQTIINAAGAALGGAVGAGAATKFAGGQQGSAQVSGATQAPGASGAPAGYASDYDHGVYVPGATGASGSAASGAQYAQGSQGYGAPTAQAPGVAGQAVQFSADERAFSAASAMLTCSKCGSAVPAGSKFCLECGDEIGGGFCSQCGSALLPGSKFCSQCGTRVG